MTNSESDPWDPWDPCWDWEESSGIQFLGSLGFGVWDLRVVAQSLIPGTDLRDDSRIRSGHDPGMMMR